MQYDPYGEVLTSTLPVTLTDRLFTGQRLDSSSGLYYYNARYYDPDPSASLRASLGRFIQPDTLVPDPLNPQAWNRFSYVYNNPVTFNDPSGHGVPAIVLVAAIGFLAGEIYAGTQGYTPLDKVDDGGWTAWLTATTDTEAVYSGERGHLYTFRARTTDRACAEPAEA